jgi:hypothetical protein
MKGFIKLTNVTYDGDSETLTLPIAGIAFRPRRDGKYGDKPGTNAAIWFEPAQDNDAVYTVRESPSEIAALIREAQAPSVDEVAAGLLIGAAANPSASGLSEDDFVKFAHKAADALVAERARRNATAGTTSTPASPETAPQEDE